MNIPIYFNFFFKQHIMYFVKWQVNSVECMHTHKEKLTGKPNVNEGWRFRVDHPAHINKDGHQLKAQFLKFPAEYGMLQAHLECRDKIYQYLYGENFKIKNIPSKRFTTYIC